MEKVATFLHLLFCELYDGLSAALTPQPLYEFYVYYFERTSNKCHEQCYEWESGCYISTDYLLIDTSIAAWLILKQYYYLDVH